MSARSRPATLIAICLMAVAGAAAALAQSPSAAPLTLTTAASPSPVPLESISAGAPTFPPNGVYQALITAADLEAKGVSHTDAVNNAGPQTWVIMGGKGSINNDNGEPPCGETFAMDGSVVSYTMDGTGGCSPTETYEFRWTLAGDELTVTFVTGRLSGMEDAYTSTFGKAFLERTWKKIE